MGKKRAALRSFSACRQGWGRHGTATLGGSHGGHTQYREECTGGRGRAAREREREREEGGSASRCVSRRSFSLTREAGGGIGVGHEKARRCFPVLNEEDSEFAKSPPGHWRFLGKEQNSSKFGMKSMFCICLNF
jgi:hypothetical protein